MIFGLTLAEKSLNTVSMLIVAALLAIAGLIALGFALKNSAEGYEDDLGFHKGIEPQVTVLWRVQPGAESLSAKKAGKRVRQKIAEEMVQQATLRFY
ncbi:MAG: hypothetical protein JWM88_1914 [Verrucomicrobia bacterium]|nr:hypothetical protein [Verrucomicrobiota bacterium]